MRMAKPKILFLDDHNSVREGMIFYLRRTMPFAFFGAGNLDDAKKILLENPDCETLVLDIDLGGGQSGFDALEELRKVSGRSLRTLFFSMHSELALIERAVRENAQGFVCKDAPYEKLVAAIEAVASGKTYFEKVHAIVKNGAGVLDAVISAKNDYEVSSIMAFSCYNDLTQKEKELFRLLAGGLSTKEAALILGKSLKTVENQRTAINSKMGFKDRHDLIETARLLGIESAECYSERSRAIS